MIRDVNDVVLDLRNFYTEDETHYEITHSICDEAADVIERLALVLEWYASEAEALAKHMHDKKPSGDAVLASVTVLTLDGGERARVALGPDRG